MAGSGLVRTWCSGPRLRCLPLGCQDSLLLHQRYGQRSGWTVSTARQLLSCSAASLEATRTPSGTEAGSSSSGKLRKNAAGSKLQKDAAGGIAGKDAAAGRGGKDTVAGRGGKDSGIRGRDASPKQRKAGAGTSASSGRALDSQGRTGGLPKADTETSSGQPEGAGRRKEGNALLDMSFAELGLAPNVVLRLQALGFTSPSEVQAAAIPALLRGHDAAVQSFTGSGKTLAYLLPLLSRVGPWSYSGEIRKHSQRGVEAVVVAPSRELAMQIVRETERLLGPDYRLLVQQLIGGASMARQEVALRNNRPLIVVGTPGRLAELSRLGRLQTHSTRFLILDEADQLLSLHFRSDLVRLLDHIGCPRTRPLHPTAATLSQALGPPGRLRKAALDSAHSATVNGAVADRDEGSVYLTKETAVDEGTAREVDGGAAVDGKEATALRVTGSILDEGSALDEESASDKCSVLDEGSASDENLPSDVEDDLVVVSKTRGGSSEYRLLISHGVEARGDGEVCSYGREGGYGRSKEGSYAEHGGGCEDGFDQAKVRSKGGASGASEQGEVSSSGAMGDSERANGMEVEDGWAGGWNEAVGWGNFAGGGGEGGAAVSEGDGRVERQLVLVSATMPRMVVQAAAKWGHMPLHITTATTTQIGSPSPDQLLHATTPPLDGTQGQLELGTATTPAPMGAPVREPADGLAASLPPNLDHHYVLAPLRHHVDALRRAIHATGSDSVIVFMNYGRRLKDAEYKLKARNMGVGSLHGGLTKVERSNVLSAFREGRLRVLLVSEVGARGIDVVQCDLVVNLELPSDASHYAHRAGRTGRIGRSGLVLSIIEAKDEFVLEKFEKQLGIQIGKADLARGNLTYAKV